MKTYLTLNQVTAYKKSYQLSNYVWQCVLPWSYFAKHTLGEQFVRAVDSISANIAEGFGRYSKKDKVKFYRYSKGSTLESLDWNEKAKSRTLLTNTQYQQILKTLKELPKEINQLIKFTNTHLAI